MTAACVVIVLLIRVGSSFEQNDARQSETDEQYRADIVGMWEGSLEMSSLEMREAEDFWVTIDDVTTYHAGGTAYFALMESSSRQATFGKMLLDLKVTDAQGAPIGFGRASGRFFGKFVSAITLGIGFFMAGFTDRKQAFHDMMAGCLVVRES